MIVDRSALLAVFLRQPGCEQLLSRLATASAAGVPAPLLVEVSAALGARLGNAAAGLLARFLSEFEIAVVPFGEVHARAATEALRRFGRGAHPAALDASDAIAYAVARLARRPLLSAAKNFAKTDLELA